LKEPAVSTTPHWRRSDMIGYGPERVGLWVMQVDHPIVPDMQSGLHFCFVAPDEAAVDAFHAAAIASGGTDNGEPGIRPDYGRFYYAAFIIDPDGYRLEAYFHKGEL
jgi:catechol 2,3-dioxygenase-like lactoylglutathione lyase family enzyme